MTADREKLGAKEPHALGAQLPGAPRLARQVQVRAERDGLAVQRDGRPRRARPRGARPAADPRAALLEPLRLRGAGLDHHLTGAPVHDDRLAVAGSGEDLPQPHHRRDAHRPGQDRPVGGPRPRVGGEPPDGLGRQPRHEARRELPSHDHGVALALEVPGTRQAEQAPQHAQLDVAHVVQPIQDHRVGGARPELRELQHPPFERPRGRDPVLPDVPLRALDHLRILQHEDLGVEDAGLDPTQARLGPPPDPLQFGARPAQGVLEAFELPVARSSPHRRARHLRDPPVDPPHPPHGDAVGGREALEVDRCPPVIHRSRASPAGPAPPRPGRHRRPPRGWSGRCPARRPA